MPTEGTKLAAHATGGTESKTPRNSLLEHVPDSDKLESGTGKGERPRIPDFRQIARDGDGARSRSPDKSGTSTGTVPKSMRVPSSST